MRKAITEASQHMTNGHRRRLPVAKVEADGQRDRGDRHRGHQAMSNGTVRESVFWPTAHQIKYLADDAGGVVEVRQLGTQDS